MTASAHDIDILARTIYGEARGTTLVGMRVPANVAVNRAKHAVGRPQFGDGSIAGACLAHEQFSCWNRGDPNLPIIQNVTLDSPAFQLCMMVALETVHETVSDPTQGYLFYWSLDIDTPSWAIAKPFISLAPFRLVENA